MQSRKQRHFGRLAQISLALLDQLRRLLDFFWIAVRLLLQNRQVADRLVELEIFFRLHRSRANFAEALEIF